MKVKTLVSDLMGQVCGVIILFAMIYVVAVKAYNWPNYLPAPSYATGVLDTWFWVSLAIGLLMSAIWLGPKVLQAYRRRPHQPHNEDFVALCMAMLLWSSVYIFFVGIGPLFLSYAVGEKREFTYAVSGPASDYRACSQAIHLENLSFWNDRLCGVPDEIRHQLSQCDRVTVEGIGTRFGLRVTQIIAVHPTERETRQSLFEDCSS